MARWTIVNVISGAVLGEYEAATYQDAYADHAATCAVEAPKLEDLKFTMRDSSAIALESDAPLTAEFLAELERDITEFDCEEWSAELGHAIVARLRRDSMAAPLMPAPPIVARMVPADKRAAFLAIRNAVFSAGYLTGDQADVWAWRAAVSEPANAEGWSVDGCRQILASVLSTARILHAEGHLDAVAFAEFESMCEWKG